LRHQIILLFVEGLAFESSAYDFKKASKNPDGRLIGNKKRLRFVRFERKMKIIVVNFDMCINVKITDNHCV